MSNYSDVTARSKNLSLKESLNQIYPGYVIDDAIVLSLDKNIVLGLSGLGRNIPVLQEIIKKPNIKKTLANLHENEVALLNKDTLLVNDKEIELSKEAQKEKEEALALFKNYGGKLNDEGEHLIDLKSPTIGSHFGVNLLLGDRGKLNDPLLTTPKAVVDQFGGGSFRGPAAHQVLATRWDMNPSENGNPFNRQFYLLENGKQIFFSHNVNENVKTATCVHKVNRSEITYETMDGLLIKRLIYLRRQKNENEPIALERQVIEITNLKNEERNLEIVFTGVFGSANPECQMVDVIYQSVINQTKVIFRDDKPIAISPDYYPEYAKEYIRFFSLGKDGFDSFSYDVDNFLGNGSIEHPQNINSLGNQYKMKGTSFFALAKTFSLRKKATKVIVSSTGLLANKQDIATSIETIIDKDYKKEVKEIVDSFAKYSSYFQIKDEDKKFESYVNKNLPFQILYQTYVSRAFAQTQKGYREIGFREIQDLYTSMNYFVNNGQTKLVKSLLEKWIVNVYAMGYANHNFFFEGKEPGMCSDDQLWLVDAIKRYLDLTNDYSLLDKKFLMAGKTRKRSLYETLKAIIVYSSQISVGKHGIPLLDKADWNDCLKIDDDCLDGPEKERRYLRQLKRNRQPYGVRFESDLSESVMNGFLLVIAIDDMIALARKRNEKEYIAELTKQKKTLVNSLRANAYINGYYARVLINRKDSKYRFIGAPGDGLSLLDDFDGSLYLNSLSWSILSGVAKEGEIESMIRLCDKHLKTKAGYKLCTPHDLRKCGSKEAATEQYFLGDRENGGVFKHATMMFAVAMFKAAKIVKDGSLKSRLLEDADYMLKIVYPFNVLKDPYKFKGNPRFCTQYVNSITEEHIGPILSGTSTWLFLALKEKMNLLPHNSNK